MSAGDVQGVPERICPDCRSRHYARCDERHEDGKFHPGSILRCIECKATYLDPALAASPEVQALIREAEARGMERAAKEARETDYPWASPTNEQADACDQMAERIASWLERCAAALRKGEEPK